MKMNLLSKAVLIATTTSVLSACGVDEGRNYNFSAATPVDYVPAVPPVLDEEGNEIEPGIPAYVTPPLEDEFDVDGLRPIDTPDPLAVTMNTEDGMVSIDLAAGTTINGVAVNPAVDAIAVREFIANTRDDFQTPMREGDGVTEAEVFISPFSLASVANAPLVVDATAFADSLDTCGLDKPSSAVYDISYILDNGYDFTQLGFDFVPPTRSLTLTINASSASSATDIIVSPAAIMMELAPEGSGEVIATPINVSALPEKACQDFVYSLVNNDPDQTDPVAVLNETNTAVIAQNPGLATLTVSIRNTDISFPPIPVTVEPAFVSGDFTVEIQNKQVNDIKVVPACVPMELEVQPKPKPSEELTGEYVYKWLSADTTNYESAVTTASGFGELALFMPTYALNPADEITPFKVSASLESGDTGTYPIGDVVDAEVNVHVKYNVACERTNVEAGGTTPWSFDGRFESQGPYTAANGSVTAAITSDSGGLRDEGLKVTLTDDLGDTGFHGVMFFQWNGGEAIQEGNFHGYKMGRGASTIGKVIQTSVWVKLDYTDEPAGDVVLQHKVYGWDFDGSGDAPYEGQDRRNWPEAAHLAKTLKKTTEWQLVEFMNTNHTPDDASDDTPTFTIPDTWRPVSGGQMQIMQEFHITGLTSGDSFTLDDYGFVELPATE